ncbi:hypothetical protein E2C01_027500 [Portunus trituberculatus]|uniref:Uncharacterized protein n=1 Tax=Portunus trituberculatus TaxID=210409 RepID=A0A5B7EIA1_PORTR|nr:hypothetical protein [Portunus trituberculatus]
MTFEKTIMGDTWEVVLDSGEDTGYLSSNNPLGMIKLKHRTKTRPYDGRTPPKVHRKKGLLGKGEEHYKKQFKGNIYLETGGLERQ